MRLLGLPTVLAFSLLGLSNYARSSNQSQKLRNKLWSPSRTCQCGDSPAPLACSKNQVVDCRQLYLALIKARRFLQSERLSGLHARREWAFTSSLPGGKGLNVLAFKIPRLRWVKFASKNRLGEIRGSPSEHSSSGSIRNPRERCICPLTGSSRSGRCSRRLWLEGSSPHSHRHRTSLCAKSLTRSTNIRPSFLACDSLEGEPEQIAVHRASAQDPMFQNPGF